MDPQDLPRNQAEPFSQPSGKETPNNSGSGSKSSDTSPFFVFALVVFLGILIGRIVWTGGAPGVGAEFPPLTAAGWIHGPAPAPDDFAGKVVVFDCWASWCGPCVAALPELAKLYPQLQEKGVVLIGLTPEPAGDLPSIARTLDNAGATWPVGYGVEDAFDSLDVQGMPTYFVFDKSGTLAWSSHSHRELMRAVTDALAD